VKYDIKCLEENEISNSFCSISGSWGPIVKSQHTIKVQSKDGSEIIPESEHDTKLLQGRIRQGSAIKSANQH